MRPERAQPVPPRMIVGITGATGIAYGVRVLQSLRAAGVETHLVVSKPGEMTRAHETTLSSRDLRALADHAYAPNDIAARSPVARSG